MASYSQYKNLELPQSIEHYNINIFNKNAMVIDSELHKLDLKNQSQDELLATKESLNSEITRATSKENDIIDDLASEISRAKSAENSNADDISNEVTRALIAEENINTTLQNHISDESNPHHVTKEQIDLCNVDNTSDTDKPVSTAQQNALDSALSTHNTSDSSHNDMRLLISELTTRLNALADSDDTTLDQLSEIVAYIKNNKSLIDGITTSKVNISDIIDDLTTNSGDKVLSAKQGTILKGLITDLTVSIPTKISQLENDSGYKTTDNNTWRGIQNNLTSDSVTESLAAAQGKVLKTLIDGKSASNHNHNGYYVYDKGNVSGTMNDVAGYRNAMGMINLVAPSSGDAKYVNPNGQTGWHHFINISYVDQSGSNMWQTQIANKAGTSDLWIRSRSGGSIDNTQQWNAPWVRVITESNYSKVLNSGGITYSDSQPTTLSAGMTWIGN